MSKLITLDNLRAFKKKLEANSPSLKVNEKLPEKSPIAIPQLFKRNISESETNEWEWYAEKTICEPYDVIVGDFALVYWLDDPSTFNETDVLSVIPSSADMPAQVKDFIKDNLTAYACVDETKLTAAEDTVNGADTQVSDDTHAATSTWAILNDRLYCKSLKEIDHNLFIDVADVIALAKGEISILDVRAMMPTSKDHVLLHYPLRALVTVEMATNGGMDIATITDDTILSTIPADDLTIVPDLCAALQEYEDYFNLTNIEPLTSLTVNGKQYSTQPSVATTDDVKALLRKRCKIILKYVDTNGKELPSDTLTATGDLTFFRGDVVKLTVVGGDGYDVYIPNESVSLSAPGDYILSKLDGNKLAIELYTGTMG